MVMNFNEKLKKQFQDFTLETPNVQKYIEHVYADFVELNALFQKEEVTVADISDKLQDIKDSNILEVDALDDVENKLEEIASLEAEKNDIIEERFYSIFNVCRERESLYSSDEYPFIIKKNQIKLKEHLSSKHKLYILLLLCSNLNCFKDIASELAVDFETLSFYSLKSFLPPKAIIKVFGKKSLYKGNAKTKISKLAEELNMRINLDKLNSIPNTNTQERGLDIIAWLPFIDRIPNMIIILAQCACGKEWNYKQYDTQRFKEFLCFSKLAIHAMFIPYAISIPMKKKFHQHDEILYDQLLFDRKRIIEQLEEFEFISELQSFLAVEKSIRERIAV